MASWVRGLASTCAMKALGGEEWGQFSCLLVMKGPGAHQLLIAVSLEL